MIFDTSPLTPAGTGDPFLDYQVYNGLDNCITYEVHERLSELRGNELIYDFERAMQAPALEMMLRGLRIDYLARDAAVRHLNQQRERLMEILARYGDAIWDGPINPRSSPQLKSLFYGVMRLPEQYNTAKGQKTVTANREALEKLSVYFHASPICRAILAYRDLSKQVEFLTAAIDPDGRIRTSYNVAGTETGRWSSSSSAFGTGKNLQNFPDKLRAIFIPDPERKFAYCDLEQAESWIVGIRSWLVSEDDRYIRAIQSGDLHTTVAKLVWPELPWTGDLKQDRDIADRPFYRDYSYRDMAKRGGHGTNYLGTPPTMAKHLKVSKELMESFQDGYFAAFPGIRKWHHWVAQRLQLDGHLTTLLGRQRHFFGRLNDDATLREAVAYEPQSTVGDLLNLAAWRIWHRRGPVRLMAQLHDAVLVEFPDEPKHEAEVASYVTSLMRTELQAGGKTFVIPNDFSSGWNWGKFNDNPKRGPINLHGVKKLKGVETRTRPPEPGLDRVIPSFH